MALKANELKGLTLEELVEREEKTLRGLYELRVKNTTKDLTNTATLRAERRDLARIKQAIGDKKRAPKSAA
ncbi:MAG: 50S ribosomal protein L29 [Candidatus Sumerlaeaceae bacterium]|nr:50S ribosomal protein L29 [Candidatus Sumerlaeaceae bacterium]